MSARDGTFPDAVIVLAGGAGRRLGGVDKAALVVGGRTLLQAALTAAAGSRIVVVGPPRSLPAGALSVQEDPPGGGPAAGVAAGLAALAARARQASAGLQVERGAAPDRGGDGEPGPQAHRSARLVAVLAVDQPGVGAATLARLATAAASASGRGGGAVLVSEGRRQYALGVFPAGALAAAVRSRQSWHGAPLRDLVDPLVAVEVPATPDEAGDLDTPADLQRWQATGPGSAAMGPAGR